MLVKDARTAIRVRTDSQPSLVLHGWLESPPDFVSLSLKEGWWAGHLPPPKPVSQLSKFIPPLKCHSLLNFYYPLVLQDSYIGPCTFWIAPGVKILLNSKFEVTMIKVILKFFFQNRKLNIIIDYTIKKQNISLSWKF